jgi:hypothetical protein
MRSLIPRQMFDVAVQASIGANIIARETIKAMRKNVLRQVLRRRHHAQEEALEKQKAGKKRHEGRRQRGNSAGGLPGHIAGGRQVDETRSSGRRTAIRRGPAAWHNRPAHQPR